MLLACIKSFKRTFNFITLTDLANGLKRGIVINNVQIYAMGILVKV